MKRLLFATYLLNLLILMTTTQTAAAFDQGDLEKLLTSKSCYGCDLAGVDLVNADLEGAYLVKANLKGAYLVKAVLNWANLEEANLKGAKIERADLIKANLERANLKDTKLIMANLGKVNLEGASLQGADLEGANLEGAILYKANLNGANLKDTILAGAKLILADLENVNLAGAKLNLVNLEEAVLKNSNLQGVNLEKANLKRTNFEGANLAGANLKGALLEEAIFYKANLAGAEFIMADLGKANLEEADLTGANLYGASLPKAILYKADLTDANLKGADLSMAKLGKANLLRANLVDANLEGADLEMAILIDADLTGASLTSANLKGARFESTPPGQPPVAHDGAVATDEDTAVSGTLSGADANGDSLLFSLVTDATHGRVVFTDPAAGTFTYTPQENFSGPDRFGFKVNDGTTDSNIATMTVTVRGVNDAPQITTTAPAAATEDVLYTYRPAALDADNDILLWSLHQAPAGMAIEPDSGTVTWTPAEGQTDSGPVILEVTDGRDGTAAEEFIITVTAVNDAPTIAGAPATTVVRQEAYSFTPVVDDPEGQTLTFSIDHKPTWADFNALTGHLSGRPGKDAVGVSADIRITASDGELSASLPPFAIAVLDVNEPPVAHDAALATDEDMAVSGTLHGTDADNDPLLFSLTAEAAHGRVVITDAATGKFTYTPPENFNGPDSFGFKVNDGTADSNSATLTITVSGVNDGPRITTTAPASAIEDVLFTYQPAALDADGDQLLWVLRNAPAGMTIQPDSGAVGWTPVEGQAASGPVTLVVTDGRGGIDTEKFDIPVTAVNDVPSIAGAPATTVVQDGAYSFTPVVDDPEGDPLTFSIDQQPAWADFDPATGRLAGTPGNDDIGTSADITITVSDGKLSATLPPFTITVLDVNDAPQITSIAPVAAVTADDLFTYEPTALDADDDVLLWSLRNAPAGMTIEPATGAVAWRPAKGRTDSGKVTLVVTDGRGGIATEEFITIVTAADEVPAGAQPPAGVIAGGDVHKAAITANPEPESRQAALPDPARPRLLAAIKPTATATAITLEIITDGPVPDYKYFTLAEPPSLVIDLAGLWQKPAAALGDIDHELLTGIRFGNYADKLRIVMDLRNAKQAAPAVEQTAAGLMVSLTAAGPQPEKAGGPSTPMRGPAAKSRPARLLTAINPGTPADSVVEIVADGPIDEYKYSTLQDPPRLVIDLAGLWQKPAAPFGDIDHDLLKAIRFGSYPDKLRLVMDLRDEKQLAPRVAKSAAGLTVSLTTVDAPPAEAASEPTPLPTGAGAIAMRSKEPYRLLTAINPGTPADSVVEIVADGPIDEYKYSTLQDPPRLVVDLAGLWQKPAAPFGDIDHDLLKAIRFGSYPDKLRLVMDLQDEKQLAPRVAKSAAGLTVFLTAAGAPPAEEAASLPAPPALEEASDHGAAAQYEEPYRVLTAIEPTVTAAELTMEMVADGPVHQYKYFTLTDPPRLVIDLAGLWQKPATALGDIGNELLKGVRFGSHADKLRVVMDLRAAPISAVVRKSPSGIIIEINTPTE